MARIEVLLITTERSPLVPSSARSWIPTLVRSMAIFGSSTKHLLNFKEKAAAMTLRLGPSCLQDQAVWSWGGGGKGDDGAPDTGDGPGGGEGWSVVGVYTSAAGEMSFKNCLFRFVMCLDPLTLMW